MLRSAGSRSIQAGGQLPSELLSASVRDVLGDSMIAVHDSEMGSKACKGISRSARRHAEAGGACG